MKNPGNGITFWSYEVRDGSGAVSSGVIFAPSAASADWHLKRFVAGGAQARVLEEGESAA